MLWRYAKESVRRKVINRELTDDLIGRTLTEPDSISKGRGNRFVAQKLSMRVGVGELLIRVVYEESKRKRLSSRPIGRGPRGTREG